jgi:DNA-binding MarR family transcriptional regulator
VPPGDPHVLHTLLMDLVRHAGLLQPELDPGPGLSMSEAFAVHELDVVGPMTQQDLADRLHLEKSTVSRLVAGLEARQLLVRERDAGNRRFYRLRLTEAGLAAHRDVSSTFRAHFVGVLDGLSDGERESLETGLIALLRALGAAEPGNSHRPAAAGA